MTDDEQPTRPRSWFERRAVIAAVIVVVLVGLSFLNDPEGYLGTDTGGKTATLEAMVDRGDWSLDVGYWAEEYDPDGTYHPMFGTTRTDEGWIQVTSLPMILAARPLYALGGYRAALLLPIAGTVLAALAAAALAERLGSRGDGTVAGWVIGLGSPLLVYGLDLWEHSLGVAAVVWATVLLHDALTAGSWWRPPLAGALLALAATMRTEALVYSMVLVGAIGLWMLARRGLLATARLGVLTVLGFGLVWLLNGALERALGGQSRTGRATGAASSAVSGVARGGGGDGLSTRLEEGLRTTFATSATTSWVPIVIGVLLVTAVGLVTAFGDRIPLERLRIVVVVLASFTVLTVAPGLGFVPGLFAAFPVAAAALALNRLDARALVLVAAALSALPVVWGFQFIGGAGPQWAGRYVLTSTVLLGVVGVIALGHAVPRPIAGAVVAMSVFVNLFGAAWLWQRSHEVSDLFDDIVVVQGEALIARNEFFLREAGPESLDHRWLSAADPAALEGPAKVLRTAGISDFSVLQVEGQSEPDIPGATVVSVDHLPALGVVFEVVHLTFER